MKGDPRVRAIQGHEIVLLLPVGGKYILGRDDAEAIVARIDNDPRRYVASPSSKNSR